MKNDINYLMHASELFSIPCRFGMKDTMLRGPHRKLCEYRCVLCFLLLCSRVHVPPSV